MEAGGIVYEDYVASSGPFSPHRLASGSKSFWGALAVAAAQDGLIQLDEKVSDTLVEWKNDPRKSEITVRQLLNFTSGLDPATETLRGNAKSEDKFKRVLDIPSFDSPGNSFAYGPSHLFAFGAFLQRKLAAAGKNSDPLDYLHERILDPIGLRVAKWTRDKAGNPVMPYGAYISPREWAKFGELLLNGGEWDGVQLIDKTMLAEMFMGSFANPAYGLAIWLNKDAKQAQVFTVADGEVNQQIENFDDGYIYRNGPTDMVMAAGQGKQRLYVIPSRDLVIVRQGESRGGWRDSEFLAILLSSDTVSTFESGVHGGTFTNIRSACKADIMRFCPDARGDESALRNCYKRYRNQISRQCQEAVRARRH